MKTGSRLFLSLSTALAASAWFPLFAQTTIVPGSGTSSMGTSVTRAGTIYTIDGGQRSGANLFHSFETFELGSSRVARWVQSSGDAASIRAVVNRVTGGTASTIAGTIDATSLPNASFYFINPAGIVFTAGARVRVGGTAHFSTAQELRLGQDAVFTLSTPRGSVLSADAPTSFGFLGNQGSITVSGVRSGGTPFSALHFSAATLSIKDAAFATPALELVATGSTPADVPLGPGAPPLGLGGDLSIANSVLTVRPGTAGDGHVTLAGGALVFSNGRLVAQASSDAMGGNVGVQASSLALDDFQFGAATTTHFASGNVAIAAGPIALSGASRVAADSFEGAGDAGDVIVTADALDLRGTSGISARAGQKSLGDAGNVTLTVRGLLSMHDEAEIASRTEFNAVGRAGNVMIDAATLTMEGLGSSSLNRAEITSSTRGGPGGNVAINVAGTLTMGVSTDIRSAANGGATGDAGNVVIQAGRVELLSDTSRITSATEAAGKAGMVAVRSDALVVNNGEISSTTAGLGNAGTVDIMAHTIDLRGSSTVSASALAGSQGDAGTVSVEARNSLSLRQSAEISSRTEAGSTGSAGDVRVKAGSLTMSGNGGGADRHAKITSSTQGGRGGNVTIDVEGLLLLEKNSDILAGADSLAQEDGGTVFVKASELRVLTTSSQIGTSTNSDAGANAGAIRIDVGHLLVDSGRLLSVTTKSGNAGSISIQAQSVDMQGNAAVSASTLAGSSGNAGKVSLDVAGLLQVRDTAEITSRTEFDTKGNAGDIDISAGNLTMVGLATSPGNRAEITSSTRAGTGGQVRITVADTLLMGISSDIRAGANEGSTGDAGTVTIKAQHIALTAPTSRITSATSSSGNAGGIAIQASSLLVDGGEISSSSTRPSAAKSVSGNAGKVLLAADTLLVRNAGKVTTTTEGSGNGGAIAITAGQSVDIGSEGQISSAALVGSSGEAGTVSIMAPELNISSGRVTSSTAASGRAGSVSIDVKTLAVDGGEISSDVALANATGAGGTVSVQARDISLTNNGGISTSTVAGSDAGIILIGTHSFAASDGSSVRSSTSADGNAGSVTLGAATLSLQSGALIATSSAGAGTAGEIAIETRRADIVAAIITSSAENNAVGRSGSISLIARERLNISGGGRVETSSANPSRAGRIAVTGGAVSLEGVGSQIATENSSVDPGAAGEIRIEGAPIMISNGARVTSNSRAGPAGDLTIIMPRGSVLTLEGARLPGVITTSSGPQTGGRIVINHPLAIISNGGSILAQGQQGGANVQIAADYFIRSSDRPNLLSVDGQLALETLSNDVASGLESDSLTFEDASGVLRAQCANVASGAASVLQIAPLSATASAQGKQDFAMAGHEAVTGEATALPPCS